MADHESIQKLAAALVGLPYALGTLIVGDHRCRVAGRRLVDDTLPVVTAGFIRATAQTGAVTLVQHFGSALNLNLHFHMLVLDGVYVENDYGGLRFHRVKAPNAD